MRPWALLLVLALAAPAAPPEGPGAVRDGGERLLRQGRHRLAARWFRERLAEQPDDPDLHLGLGRALAAFGRCGEADAALERGASSVAWGRDAALDQARCLAALGRHAEAGRVLEEALDRVEDPAPLLLEAALLALDGGAPDDAVIAARALAALPEAEAESLLAQAALAAWWGEDDTLWRATAELRRLSPEAPRADLLLALAWLERGEPEQALALLQAHDGGRIRQPVLDAWTAEALRRAGQPDEALQRLQAGRRAADESVLGEALRLRARLDLEPASAVQPSVDALLARAPLDPEVLATAWYAARAAGRPDGELRRLHRRVAPPGRHRLDVLLPLAGP